MELRRVIFLLFATLIAGLIIFYTIHPILNWRIDAAVPGNLSTVSADLDALGELPPMPKCKSVCTKLYECNLIADQDLCTEVCPERYGRSDRECIMDTPCENITEDCMDRHQRDCEQYCRVLASCEIMDSRQCLEQCDDTSAEIMRCAMETDCDLIEQECFEFPYDVLCEPYCNRLLSCEAMAPGDFELCMETCYDESPNLVECVLEVECDQIESYCLNNAPNPLCGDYCLALVDCEWIDEEDFKLCMIDCKSESADLVECVVDAPCDEMDFCYEQDAATSGCALYCKKALDCQLMFPDRFDQCFNDCSEESIEVIDCVIESSCEEIEEVCWSNPYPLLCESACDRLNQCGIWFDAAQCYESCMGVWSTRSSQCVLDLPCEQIENDCFNPENETDEPDDFSTQSPGEGL